VTRYMSAYALCFHEQYLVKIILKSGMHNAS